MDDKRKLKNEGDEIKKQGRIYEFVQLALALPHILSNPTWAAYYFSNSDMVFSFYIVYERNSENSEKFTVPSNFSPCL